MGQIDDITIVGTIPQFGQLPEFCEEYLGSLYELGGEGSVEVLIIAKFDMRDTEHNFTSRNKWLMNLPEQYERLR